jgi:Leucine-rich repeat (LRR) protein
MVSSGDAGSSRNDALPGPAGRHAHVPDAPATDFSTGIAHWIRAVNDEPPAKRPRIKLPSSKKPEFKYQSTNFLYRANNPNDDALCTVERRAEAGAEILRVAKSKSETSLVLENMALTGLPAQIGDMAHLMELNINFNRLGSLPDQLGQLGGLKMLSAGGVNKLKNFPRVVLQLKNLVHLDLSGNGMLKVSSHIGELQNLTRLHVDSNRLERLPKQISELTKLKTFTAGWNPLLTSVPAEIGELKQLTRVDLSNTQIATLPTRWNPLIEEHLVSLNLAGTNFHGFNEELKMPKAMKALDLQGTQVRTLPSSFSVLTFYGNSDGNILRTTDRSIWQDCLKISAEGTNLAADLHAEGRMVTDQPIKVLKMVRHEDRRPPVENQDNDVDSGDDEGEDINWYMRHMGAVGPMNVAHAQRVREAAVNLLPSGRAADFAAAQAAQECGDRWGAVPARPPTLYPWGNEAVAPWPGAPMNGGVPSGFLPPMNPSTQFGMPAGPQTGRWRNQILDPGNPAYALPMAPVQPGVGWGQPYMPAQPFAAGFAPAAALQPTAGFQSQANLNSLMMGMGQFNPFAPPTAAAMQGAPAGYPPQAGAVQQPVAMQQPGAAQQPGGTPAQAEVPPRPAMTLSPYVLRGERVRPPMWAPQPTWRDTAADMVDRVSGMLRRT